MASSFVTIHFFFLLVSFSSLSCSSTSQPPNTKQHPFILPIKKDPSTNLFYTSVKIFGMIVTLTTIHHPIFQLNVAQKNVQILHALVAMAPSNQVAQTIHVLLIQSTHLPNSFSMVASVKISYLSINKKNYWSCKIKIFTTQLALRNKLPPKFSLCLPSSNKQGFTNLLVGYGGDPIKELSKFVQTTPLIVNPISTGAVFIQGVPSNEYFIDLKAIKIDGNVLNLKPSLFSIDKKGNGGTKISTLSPFTKLQNSVYKPFIRDFLKKASDRKLKRVESVAPFDACFDSTSIENSAPRIDLLLQGGVQWTIHETNLMVNVKKNVACLAFVDGGTSPRWSSAKASVVIGGQSFGV
ncbi:basic 7S globulin 2 small subunit, putative [Medicago truncatula]|uniref:Basic 7S globulin 2 small subunit, putative n=1 Tax=Medicago truncatula TaxID=3880 RepID=A0A072TGC9_MEDTR|nr:basic 7S globulin 2 small subunit, putative [Medicago truncatula]